MRKLVIHNIPRCLTPNSVQVGCSLIYKYNKITKRAKQLSAYISKQLVYTCINMCLLFVVSSYCLAIGGKYNIINNIETSIDSINYITYTNANNTNIDEQSSNNFAHGFKNKTIHDKKNVNKKSSNTIKSTATYYAKGGPKTANGDSFKPYSKLTCAAHHKYPFGTVLRITNLENNKSVIVTVTDRGKFYKQYKRQDDIDLTHFAFCKISSPEVGRINIKVEKIK